MNKNNLILRYVFFFLGLAVNSFGIAFITKSALGTSPISSVPYVCSLFFEGISFGAFTFIVNMLFIALQIILLKRDFHPIQFLQIAVNILFSSIIDISMAALDWFQPEAFPVRILSLLLGCTILAFGISIEVAPNVVVVPGEGVVRAIAKVRKADFGKTKVCFDVTLILTALCLSFLFFGSLQGLGIGTLISALIVGKIVSFINRRRGSRGWNHANGIKVHVSSHSFQYFPSSRLLLVGIPRLLEWNRIQKPLHDFRRNIRNIFKAF